VNLPPHEGLAHGAWGRMSGEVSFQGLRRVRASAKIPGPVSTEDERERGDSLTDSDCLFCRILRGEIPAELVHSDPEVVAFRDIHPQAPTHILIIPRAHIPSVNELGSGQAELMGRLFLVARELAGEEGVSEEGYRMVVNAGPAAGQTVFHIHLHLLGGRDMRWPPG
jgi:histidine triad (HIT) family protein